MFSNTQMSRDTFLTAMAAELYGSAPESFTEYSRKNSGKTVANYAYTVVFDSQQYKDNRFTEIEAEVIIDKLIKLLKNHK